MDPTNSMLVHEYIRFKHMKQGESGVLPNSAPKIAYTKMIMILTKSKLLLENLKLEWLEEEQCMLFVSQLLRNWQELAIS